MFAGGFSEADPFSTSGARTCMALALDAERYLRVNADIEDLLALVPAVHVGRALSWTLRVAHAEALSAADQPHALQRAWSQLVTRVRHFHPLFSPFAGVGSI